MAVVKVIDLLLGSANDGKVAELDAGLSGLPLRIHTLKDYHHIPSPAETGKTYEGNALLKARYYQNRTGILTLADDSGLEVEELQNQPGVLTARFGGPDLTDAQRVSYLLEKLQNATNRRARFVSVIAVVGPGYQATVRGECLGSIARAPLGEKGFGYDPVFIPDHYEETFAQLSSSVKANISHRGRAIVAARRELEAILSRGI
jgi:XTP/dITP diphosphohydrolase